jgi:hypothetical protein
MNISGSPSQNLLDELIASLPACRRCRQNDAATPTYRLATIAPRPGWNAFSMTMFERKMSRSRKLRLTLQALIASNDPRYVASLLRELQDAQPAESTSHPATAPNTYRYIGSRACLAYNTYSHAWLASSSDPPLCEPEPPVIRWEKGPEITSEIHKFLIDQ